MTPNNPDPDQRQLDFVEQSERKRRVIRMTLTCVGIVALTLTAYGLSPDQSMGSGAITARVAMALLLIIGAVVVAAISINRSEFPLIRAVETLTAVVSIMIVVFAFVYVTTSGSDSAAFSEPLDHTRALYFTVTASTTVGFGDIHPVSNSARIVVMIQMLTNVVIIGVVARGLFGSARSRAQSI